MEKVYVVLVLHLLTTSALLYTAGANERREDLIEDSVRRLLGLKPGTTRDSTPPVKNTTLPPRYMMDLYEKYRSGQTPMHGNTVRSILSMRDNMGEADVLIFNLTGINPKEKILKSQLYILKRKKPRHGKKRDASHFRMKVGILPNMTFHRYIDVSLSRQKSTWQSYDITNSVLHCRRSSQKGDNLLGITLEIKRSRNNYRLAPFRRLLKQNSQPFVLIFSEDDNNHTRHLSRTKTASEYDAIQELLKAKLDSEDSSVIPAHDTGLFRNKRSSLVNAKPKQNNLHNLNGISLPRDFLNVSTNYIQDEANRDEYSNKFQLFRRIFFISIQEKHFNKSSILQLNYSKQSYGSLKDKFLKVLSHIFNLMQQFLMPKIERTFNKIQKHKSDPITKHKLSKRSISSKLLYLTNFKDGPDATAHTFQAVEEKGKQLSNSTTSLRKLGKNNRASKKKKKRRRNRKLPFWWTRHDSRLHSQDHKRMCQRRSLVVDFTKLGWGEWVMSPKSFNAHYCTGGCTFPLIKDTNPSNHAALQSLIHAMGLNPDIPTPCCVPSATSPLTLLYFDEHGSLVLKNYPNMIVEKCACR